MLYFDALLADRDKIWVKFGGCTDWTRKTRRRDLKRVRLLGETSASGWYNDNGVQNVLKYP